MELAFCKPKQFGSDKNSELALQSIVYYSLVKTSRTSKALPKNLVYLGLKFFPQEVRIGLDF